MSDSPGPDFLGPDEHHAVALDQADPLREYRDRFHIPSKSSSQKSDPTSPDSVHYFCGNSLGLQPKGVRALIEQELDDWRDLAVHAHFDGKSPWYPYHEQFEQAGARLVGAEPGEVVMMNSLTVNLHLMMVSFYRPTAQRSKILIEDCAFPSDSYAVKSQLEFHGFDPDEHLLVAKPRDGEVTLRTEDVEALIAEHGSEIALVMMGGVNYFTGQLFDLERITRAAHAQGAAVGFDLAHAAGNAALKLHDWGVDFAVWCNYKYLNSGPGAIAGCFVHDRHGANVDLPRFAGWWGNDPKDRFQMHLLEEFIPHRVAEGWQLSNPPILAMTPLRASLAIFDEVGMGRLREKSRSLTGYLEYLLDTHAGDYEILTPRDPESRGCQLSIRLRSNGQAISEALNSAGCVCDFRKPDVIRVAPTPLYNSYRDVWVLAQILSEKAR